MAQVLTNFLIGIGWEKERFDRGTRDIERGMEGIKTTATTAGAAISAAMVGAGVRVDDLARKATDLDRAMYSSTGATTWAQGFGTAIKQAGGDAEEALSIIRRADQMRDQLSVGQGAWVDELSRIGFDTGDLAQATDSEDLLRRISTQFSHLTDQQQRLARDTLGLSDASFKLFQQGGDALERQVTALQKQQGYTQALLNQQKEYTQEVISAELAWDKLGNTVSNIMLPGMTKLAEKAAGFINIADDFIKAHPQAAKEATESGVTLASGAGVAATGALASKIGIPGGGLMRLGGNAGLLVGAGQIADATVAQPLQKRYPWLADNPVTHGIEWAQDALSPEKPLFDVPKWARETFTSNEASGKDTLVDKPVMSGYQPSYLESPAPEANDLRKSLMGGYQPSYLESQYAGGMSDTAMERMGEKMIDALRNTGAIHVKNDVTLNARVELDSRKVGEVIDDRIDYHNRNAIDEIGTQVER